MVRGGGWCRRTIGTVEGVVEGRHRIMDRVPEMAYAVETGGTARGCASLADGWVGRYAMLTAPEASVGGLHPAARRLPGGVGHATKGGGPFRVRRRTPGFRVKLSSRG
ncbi:hypothetical protein AB0I72_13735 [Nocardiopsis sp. NPDC049922]|uniref:hypothetical protein n=1 Tax=Nocardiopsis sp. NPDC049922 TaxID=3155157 RepID=UPI003403A13B